MTPRRRALIAVGGLLLLGATGFFAIAPGYVDATRNTTATTGPWEFSPAVHARHDPLLVADMHADSLLWDRNLSRRASRGHVDLPRLREGGVDLQGFTVVTKSPKHMNFDQNSGDTDNIQLLMFGQLRAPATWLSIEARAHAQARALTGLEGDDFQVIRSVADLDRFLFGRRGESSKIGGWIGLEGAHALQGDLDAVDRLFASGFRMMAPVHFFDNELGGSAHGVDKGGLTDFGRQVIARQEELGIAVDVAHGSEALIADVVAMATKPVLDSHTGVRGTCDRQRNLSDEQLRGIAATGGVIGIAFFEEATCGTDTSAIVAAIDHAVKVAGIDHVGFGSDFDGTVEVPWDVTGMPELTEALRAAGYSEEELAKLAGGNVIRVLRKTLPRG